MLRDHSDIQLEALHCFDRRELETLQAHSRYLRDLVHRHRNTLALRRIEEAYIAYGSVYIRMPGTSQDLSMPSSDEHDTEAVFHRLNNAYIERLTLSFRQDDVVLLHYMRASFDLLQCRIHALHIRKPEATIDYALVDFIGSHLKPTAYEMSVEPDLFPPDGQLVEEYTALYRHDAMHSNVSRLLYEFYDTLPAPDYILQGLFHAGGIKTCTIVLHKDPRCWLYKFVKMFKESERDTTIVRSVCVLHMRFKESSPLELAIDPHKHPPRTVHAPAPDDVFLEALRRAAPFLQHTIVGPAAPAPATLHTFENPAAGRKLDITTWGIEQEREDAGWTALHYAYSLHVSDV